MKLIRHFVNLMAVLTVVLLGAVSAHADEIGHEHGVSVHAFAPEALAHTDVVSSGHSHEDAVMHCGAPILGPEPMSLTCSVGIASVAYFGQDSATPLELSIQNLRPPRL